MSVYVLNVRNVNQALRKCVDLAGVKELWRNVSPRGMLTVEYRGTFITEYESPTERVLFNPKRDANPFFHFMEALWILDGRQDVQLLSIYNSQMAQFSDDGKVFHAPYGYRMRYHFGFDQLHEIIKLLEKEPDTRRAVISLWSPQHDLNVISKDIPCNDLILFKLREGILDMTVMNRSNDAILGAYGANAVQFSFLQEFIASSLKVKVGVYRQISDSFHIYVTQPAWKAVDEALAVEFIDHYHCARSVSPYPIMADGNYVDWLSANKRLLSLIEHSIESHTLACSSLLEGHMPSGTPKFFKDVAYPIARTWAAFKNDTTAKNRRIDNALAALNNCAAQDWRLACEEWLRRRYV